MKTDELIARLRDVVNTKSRRAGIRNGQAMFNRLDNLRPGIAEEICGTENDPFYHDDRIEGFLNKVREIAERTL